MKLELSYEPELDTYGAWEVKSDPDAPDVAQRGEELARYQGFVQRYKEMVEQRGARLGSFTGLVMLLSPLIPQTYFGAAEEAVSNLILAVKDERQRMSTIVELKPFGFSLSHGNWISH